MEQFTKPVQGCFDGQATASIYGRLSQRFGCTLISPFRGPVLGPAVAVRFESVNDLGLFFNLWNQAHLANSPPF